MEKNSKIFIAGINGLVGSAIHRELRKQGFTNIIGPTSKQLDLTNQAWVDLYFRTEKPEYVFLAAAKVGGIHANNTYPAEFIYSNLWIQTNIIHASYIHGVKKLLLLGSSCIYPRLSPQPMPESCLLTGSLEPTNEPYAIAKIAGIKMCQAYNKQYGTNFIACMPTNLFGPGDCYNLENCHVLPALIRKIHEAKERGDASYVIWGTGTPLREFLFSDDLAEACIFLMKNYNENEIINIGSGIEVSIKELAETIANVVGFKGTIIFDSTKPDGTPRKLLDLTKINSYGWKSKTFLREGIIIAYNDFLGGKCRM
jgi:GDP-L-fucose synthase